ncbi:hypothetical protein BSKO_09460 [Bryopsis sp. KO-2023]|nr:hypothetical protein BSKO_09460 [Bryopsis sp. KO-2023]
MFWMGSALSDREAILNESAWDRCKRSKIVLLTGDLKKKITGKKKFESAFDVITVGCHNVHFAWEKWELKRVAKKNCVCLIESAKYLLHLKEEQVEAFTSKVSDSTDGFERLPDKFKGVLDGALDAHLPFLATS